MTIKRLVRGRGFNEQYVDGEHLEQLIERGSEDLEYPEDDYYYDEEGVDWEIEADLERFKKMSREEIVLYVFYDEENNPVCGIKQFP